MILGSLSIILSLKLLSSIIRKLAVAVETGNQHMGICYTQINLNVVE